MMNDFDLDELECKYCGHTGMLPDGSFDVECPVCGASYSLIDNDTMQDEGDNEDEC